MTPPTYVIEAARQAAMQSPCAKSKRGAVLFNREDADYIERNQSLFGYAASMQSEVERSLARRDREREVIAGAGFNGQPLPFTCSGSEHCKRDCGKLCLHAEERAIRAAGALDDVADLELVHVKVVNGNVVPGGGPSCWQCSRLVVEVKLRGVWLFEALNACPSSECPMCSNEECRICLFDPRMIRDDVQCEHDVVERHTGYTPPVGAWKFYSADEFHAKTLQHERLGDR